MKRLLFITLTLLVACSAYAGNWKRSKEISANELPKTSQNIIRNSFGSLSSVSVARLWPDNYGVYLQNGCKLNFYRDGSLKEAKAENRSLPKIILKELPGNVSSYIMGKYGNWELVKVEAKREKIEVKLERGELTAKLKFSGSGNLLKEKIDD